jgi:hypothetical protein
MTTRRLVSLAAAALIAIGGTAVAATPAQATPPGCQLGFGHYEQAGGYITGYKYWFCVSGNDVPLYVEVQRYLSPGVFQTVASGYGEATYNCAGSLFNEYKTTNTSKFGILCS